MRPTIELFDKLVVGQPRGHHSPHHRVWSHPRYSDISRASERVLAILAASTGRIDCRAAVGRVDYHHSVAQSRSDLLEERRQPLQIG